MELQFDIHSELWWLKVTFRYDLFEKLKSFQGPNENIVTANEKLSWETCIVEKQIVVQQLWIISNDRLSIALIINYFYSYYKLTVFLPHSWTDHEILN